MLRDVVELRDNKWVPCREDNYNPKTIDQIHKEAQMEKMQKQRLAAQKKGGPGKVLVLIICLVFLSSASPKIEHSYWFVSSRRPTVRTGHVNLNFSQKVNFRQNVACEWVKCCEVYFIF